MCSGYFHSDVIEETIVYELFTVYPNYSRWYTYADLHVIGKSPETEIVHGKENKVIYTDIEFIKRKMGNKFTP